MFVAVEVVELALLLLLFAVLLPAAIVFAVFAFAFATILFARFLALFKLVRLFKLFNVPLFNAAAAIKLA